MVEINLGKNKKLFDLNQEEHKSFEKTKIEDVIKINDKPAPPVARVLLELVKNVNNHENIFAKKNIKGFGII